MKPSFIVLPSFVFLVYNFIFSINILANGIFSTQKFYQFKNDSLIQNIEITEINSDTLFINIESYRVDKSIKYSISGVATRDTVGDFLNEEETMEDLNGEAFSVLKYSFVDKLHCCKFVIYVERFKMEKIIIYENNTFNNGRCSNLFLFLGVILNLKTDFK
ncbi:MAG: hypothetical protein L6Q77_08565 [Bacteroidetes bacterium]|nr:hypothetical protein [Bacteroidota bacterium]